MYNEENEGGNMTIREAIKIHDELLEERNDTNENSR